MSRYITDENVGKHEKDVMEWIASKQKEINNMKVPDFMNQRKAKGYYDGDIGGVELKEMREFWKIPANTDKMLDSMIERAKIFATGYTTGPVGLATQANKAFSLVDFSDSDAALDKGNLLWYYLTPAEQEQASRDDKWQTASQVLGVLGGVFLGQPELLMASANQGTRESLQEVFGFRHPDLLNNAVKRFNDDLEKQEEIKRQIKLNKMALDEVKQDYETAQLSAEIAQKNMQPVMDKIIQNTGKQMIQIPHTTHLPSASNIPVNLMKGRGLNNFSSFLIPEKTIYERRLAGGRDNIIRHSEIMGVRY